MNANTNTSATGGALVVAPGLSLVDIEDVLGDVVAALTGLARSLVRPRWQEEPPAQPPRGETWCAFGVTGRETTGHQLICGSAGARLRQEERITCLASFYGPRSAEKATSLKACLRVPQNQELLRPFNLVFVSVGAETRVPEAVAGGWVGRVDLPLVFRAATPVGAGRVAVHPIASAPIRFTKEGHTP